jgi:hypothetical protein
MSIVRSIVSGVVSDITSGVVAAPATIFSAWQDGVNDVGSLASPTLPTTADWTLRFKMFAAAGWTPGANTYGIGQRTSSGNQMMLGLDSAGTTVRCLVGGSTMTIPGFVRGVEYEASIVRLGDLFTVTLDGLGTTNTTEASHVMSTGATKIGLVTGSSHWKGVFRDIRSYDLNGDIVGRWLINGNTNADAEDQEGSNNLTWAGDPGLASSPASPVVWAAA